MGMTGMLEVDGATCKPFLLTSVLHCIILSFLVGIAILGLPYRFMGVVLPLYQSSQSHTLYTPGRQAKGHEKVEKVADPAKVWLGVAGWWVFEGQHLRKNMMIIKHFTYTPIDAENQQILLIHLWIPSESMRAQGKVLNPLKIISCAPRSVQWKGHIIYIPRCLLEDLEGKKWKNTTTKTRNLGSSQKSSHLNGFT